MRDDHGLSRIRSAQRFCGEDDVGFRPRLFLRQLIRQRFTTLPEPPAPRSCLNLNLAGKVALVTGATGEIGRAISRTLAACGADVVVHCHRNRERAEALCEEVKALGVRSCITGSDVTYLDSVAAMKDDISRTLGSVDIVVVNAISWHAKTTVLELPIEEFEEVYRTCVVQAVNLAKVFVPGMIERRWGRIIGISSEVAMQALSHTGPYTAGKRGLDGVLRVLAREVGPYQITVNQVAPGWVISDRDRSEATERRLEYESSVPLQRRGFDQDVANTVAFLASNLAGFISGVYLPVCGGNVMPAI